MSCVWFHHGQAVPLCWKFEMSRTNSGDLHESEARQTPSQTGKWRMMRITMHKKQTVDTERYANLNTHSRKTR